MKEFFFVQKWRFFVSDSAGVRLNDDSKDLTIISKIQKK